MSWRLPKRKSLGPGFTIRIEEGELTDCGGEWTYNERGGVIRIQKGMTKANQRYYYSHELIHATVDYHLEQAKRGAVPL